MLPSQRVCVPASIVSATPDENGLYEFRLAVNEGLFVEQGLALDKLTTENYLANPVVLYNHGWGFSSDLPVGITRSLCFGPNGYSAKMKFVEGDNFADRVKNMVDQGALRGASITFRRGDEGEGDLIEWSIVDVPRDAMAVVSRGLESSQTQTVTMSNTNTDPAPVTNSCSDAAPGNNASGRSEVDQLAQAHERELESMRAENRRLRAVALTATYRELIPENTDVSSFSSEEDVLRAAVGDQVDADASLDYMRATADIMLRERASARSQHQSAANDLNDPSRLAGSSTASEGDVAGFRSVFDLRQTPSSKHKTV